MPKTEAEAAAKREKKEKKDKKRKHAEIAEPDGDEAAMSAEKAAKREKKEKKRKGAAAEVVDVDAHGDAAVPDAAADVTEVKEEDVEEKEKKVKVDIPLAALVPFANPLCDEKAQKKVLKTVKKGKSLLDHLQRLFRLCTNPSTAAKAKTLKRGVKECVKAIRKSPIADPSVLSLASKNPTNLSHGIVVLAADISPMDVISHIPVLCEDHNIPYLYVPSRAELGAAGSTKRPTSVVMLTLGGKKAEGEEGEGWEESYGELHKLAVKLGQHVKV